MILDNEDILINNSISEITIDPIIDKIKGVIPLNDDDKSTLCSFVGVYKFNEVHEFKKFIKIVNDNDIYSKLNLNWIDVSDVTNMSFLFINSQFNGDISKWDMKNVKNMDHMFFNSQFNGDISKWDVSGVRNMSNMFQDSQFDGDISKWDVSNVKDMSGMFFNSQFNGDISKWDVSSVENMSSMFKDSKFNGDISNWNVSNVKNMNGMFKDSEFNGDISKWDVSNLKHTYMMFENSQFTGDISKWKLKSILNKIHKLIPKKISNIIDINEYISYNTYINYENYRLNKNNIQKYDYIELTNKFILSKLLNIDCANNISIIENSYKIDDMIRILEYSVELLDISGCARLYHIPKKFIKHCEIDPPSRMNIEIDMSNDPQSIDLTIMKKYIEQLQQEFI